MSILQVGLEGLQRAEQKLDSAAQRIARTPLSAGEPTADVVDLSAEVVALLTAKHAYEASLKIIETGDDLSQNVLNVLG